MRSRVQDKIKAISLRMEGLSYKEIMEEVPVSKGLLSSWLKYIKLNKEQEDRLFEKIRQRSSVGRANAVAIHRAKREKREKEAYEQALLVYNNFKHDPMFVAGVCLYWAEGSKRTSSFQFMNSDPNMIRFMIFWVQKYLNIKEKDIFLRVHTHSDFISENYEDFWIGTTGVPRERFRKTIYKPNETHGKFKKNPNYRGCIRIEVNGGMALLRKAISLYLILNSDLEMLYSIGQ